jgi:membrane protein required for colicin V production
MSGIGPFTLLDLALIAIVAISALAAMYRGLTREILSILSWAVAAIAVVYFVRYHRDIAEAAAKQFTDPPPSSYVIISQVAMGGIIFLVVLVLVHLITARISDTVLDSRIGVVDRVLGLVFGAIRGFIIVVIPFMFYESFFPKEEQQYPWVRNALFQPYIKGTGNTLKIFLEGLVPNQLRGTGEQRQGSRPPEDRPAGAYMASLTFAPSKPLQHAALPHAAADRSPLLGQEPSPEVDPRDHKQQG